MTISTEAPEAPGGEPFTPTEGDMLGTAYGVTGCTVGEDGEDGWILMGHVEPRKALSAVVRLSRDHLLLDTSDVFWGRNFDAWSDLYPLVTPMWAVFTRPRGHDWWCETGDVTADTPGAIPITWVTL